MTFKTPSTVSRSEIYWFDDTGRGGVRVPASWKLLYRDGDAWKPVETTDAFGVARNAWNTLTFKPVTTTALRVEVDDAAERVGRGAGVEGEVMHRPDRASSVTAAIVFAAIVFSPVPYTLSSRPDLQVGRNADFQVGRNADLQVGRHADLQAGRHVGLPNGSTSSCGRFSDEESTGPRRFGPTAWMEDGRRYTAV